MIGRADIEDSKSNVAMVARLPQASYPCGNFFDTSGDTKSLYPHRGSLGHAFTVRVLTGDQNQGSFCPYTLRQSSTLKRRYD
jgi:hypothetical protein